MLQKAGVKVPLDKYNNAAIDLEISSLCALDEFELKEKLSQNFEIKNNLYLD